MACVFAGDIVVSVNGQSLAGLTRQEASAIIKNSSDIVDLHIIRGKQSEQSLNISPLHKYNFLISLT